MAEPLIDQIIQLAIGNGLWAVLFVILFLYQIKDGNKREKKYIDIIDALSNDVAVIKRVDNQLNVAIGHMLSIKKLLLKKRGEKGEI